MISLRWSDPNAPAVTIKPPLGRSADGGELTDSQGQGGIAKDRDPRHVRRDLLEQFQPFPAQTIFLSGKTRGVAPRPRQARDVTGTDGVGDRSKHDRQSAGGLLYRREAWAVGSEDNVRRERNQIGRISAIAFNFACHPAIIDLHVLANRPTQFLQPL